MLWNLAVGWPWVAWSAVLLGAGLVAASAGLLLAPGADRWFDALVVGGLAALVLVAVGTTAGTAGNVLRWGRTTERVTVVLGDCRVTDRQWDEVGGWSERVECRHTWSVGDRVFDERRAADRRYPDGHELRRWATPGRAELDEHGWTSVAVPGAFAVVTDGLVLFLAWVVAWSRVRGPGKRAAGAAGPDGAADDGAPDGGAGSVEGAEDVGNPRVGGGERSAAGAAGT
ncbi:hypothetical protein PUR61_08550 [Streptomyces sp. BE20]|uniref:hypothetical protein n=1 Tax=Streptomyces sp. BE20 TaxID=3002525 RepID=UPI002E78B2FE|nr:hypothetical protein [Streptomyces sp. BE20]MEE1822242.1 hypothetical protein [Streptomyces sp. BE20]